MNIRSDRNRELNAFHGRLAGFALSIAATLGLTAGLALADDPIEERRPALILNIDGAGSSTVSYDARGIPQIRAQTEAGAYAGLCWAVARDRLFQLDLHRRTAQGRLSEVFGAGPDDAVLSQDKLFRVLGLDAVTAGLYARASAHSRLVVSACAAGIETYRATVSADPAQLPREFGVLGYVPEPWTSQDSLLMAVYLAATLDMGTWMTKLSNASLAANIAPEVMAAIAPGAPANPSLFDASGGFNSLNSTAAGQSAAARIAAAGLSPMRRERTQRPPLFRQTYLAAAAKAWRASNNFVISGRLSSTGQPILANDPHLQLAMPSLFYQAHMTVDGQLDVAGYLSPGFPAFLLGHNTDIGWAVTYGMLDTADLYLETADGSGMNKGRASWSERTEIFRIAGGEPVSLQVLSTPHGPVLNSALPELNAFGGPISLKNTLSQAQYQLDGLIDLASADDWREFRDAVSGSALGLNYLYADHRGASGNIGYQMSGLAPQRPAANAKGPVPGDVADFEWQGYARFADLPTAFNPAQGFIATSNNRIVPDDYAPGGRRVYLSAQWDEPFRAQRANNLLANAHRPITPEFVAAMQRDTTSVVGVPLARSLAGAMRRAGLRSGDSATEATVRLLERWNGNIAAYSRGAAVYEMVVALLTQNLVRDVVGADLYSLYASTVFQSTQFHALCDLLANPRPPFFGATSVDDAPQARDRAVRRAVAEAEALLSHTFGANRTAWTWGALHTLTYNHPLAPVDPAFALPSYAAGGDPSTLNTGGWFGGQILLALPPEQLDAAGGAVAAFAQDGIASARMVLNLGSLGASQWVNSTGQSGNPYSPHWADQAALWRAGRYLTTRFP